MNADLLAFGERLMPHLVIVPILLPMLAAAAMLLLGEKRRRANAVVNVTASLLGLAAATLLLRSVHHQGQTAAIGVYLPSNWDVPYGIVLAADRLSASMLLLTAVVGLAAVLFAVARWDQAGVHFHPLFQLQLMGLNGAFLTADLFNLFVFFEVLLAASYGLLLHGSGRARVKSGLHYIAVNLAASSLFLIGVSMVYGIAGTLTMADLAARIPHVPAADRGLLHAGIGIMAVAFLTKAAMWPLDFWLVPAYSAAAPPVGAVFALLSKVGLYTVLRLWTLLFPATAGASAFFGGDVLVVGGLATLAFGAAGMLASIKLERLVGYGVLVSAGTLLGAFGFGRVPLTASALFYLFSSTLTLAALFLLTELVERSRFTEGVVTDESALLPIAPDAEPAADVNLDDQAGPLIGRAFAAPLVVLGLAFVVCTLLMAGLPPLAGFVGKLGMLLALLGASGSGMPGLAAWTLVALLIVSGLLSLLAMTRAGIRFFWAPQDRPAPPVKVLEGVAVGLLLGVCVALTARAEAVMDYARATANALHRPSGYVDAVLSARPLPSPSARDVPATSPAPPAPPLPASDVSERRP